MLKHILINMLLPNMHLSKYVMHKPRGLKINGHNGCPMKTRKFVRTVLFINFINAIFC